MCGIAALLGERVRYDVRRIDRMVSHIHHRGPDACGVWRQPKAGVMMAHTRLAIMDPASGTQPIISTDGKRALAVNGEIYNHDDLRTRLTGAGHTFVTRSDCEVLMPMCMRSRVCEQLLDVDGMFAFVYVDTESRRFVVARDHIGIIPLYYGWTHDGCLAIASELKCLEMECVEYDVFPPGHIMCGSTTGVRSVMRMSTIMSAPARLGPSVTEGALRRFDITTDNNIATMSRWYPMRWSRSLLGPSIPMLNETLGCLRDALVEAVGKCTMSDVRWGVLLSGGLDSSLVASIARRFHNLGAPAEYAGSITTVAITAADVKAELPVPRASLASTVSDGAGARPLETFSIGLAGSPDLQAAREVAEFLGSDHTEVVFTIEDAIECVPLVVRALETYDVTTIRAGTPMYMLASYIRRRGIKMVMSGEGADEIMAGYLYFHHAPNAQELHAECVRKLSTLHYYDCLRANKAMAAFGVEARVPFLTREFVDIAMSLDPELKRCGGGRSMEKTALRCAFDIPKDPYLPVHILFRQKEQFSDGVGYAWIDSMKAHAAAIVPDEALADARRRFPYQTPATSEAYWIRDLFAEAYPSASACKCVRYEPSIACSSKAATEWTEAFKASGAFALGCSRGRSQQHACERDCAGSRESAGRLQSRPAPWDSTILGRQGLST